MLLECDKKKYEGWAGKRVMVTVTGGRRWELYGR